MRGYPVGFDLEPAVLLTSAFILRVIARLSCRGRFRTCGLVTRPQILNRHLHDSLAMALNLNAVLCCTTNAARLAYRLRCLCRMYVSKRTIPQVLDRPQVLKGKQLFFPKGIVTFYHNRWLAPYYDYISSLEVSLLWKVPI